MLNSNVKTISVYVGTDGKIHFKNSAGADTALNFSSGPNLPIKFENGTITNTSGEIKVYVQNTDYLGFTKFVMRTSQNGVTYTHTYEYYGYNNKVTYDGNDVTDKSLVSYTDKEVTINTVPQLGRNWTVQSHNSIGISYK